MRILRESQSTATTGASSILAGVAARPTTNVSLVIRPDTLGGSCRILDQFNAGAKFALQDARGLPFGFPNSFHPLPGSVVQVAGYTDVTNPACAYPAIEVTTILLNNVPLATDADVNGNLLVDSWEERFFGYVGLANPFLDSDGDRTSHQGPPVVASSQRFSAPSTAWSPCDRPQKKDWLPDCADWRAHR